MTTKNLNKDVEVLSSDVDDEALVLLDGTKVYVQRLRTRQLFKLLKILTVGAADMLSNLSFSSETTEEDFAAQMVALIAVSIPEAEDEAIEFVRSMLLPEGIIERPRTRDERDQNEEKMTALAFALENPELEDLFDIFNRIVRNEAPTIQSLGKKIRVMFQKNVAPVAQTNSSKKS